MRLTPGIFFFVALTFAATITRAQAISDWDALAITSCHRLQPNASDCRNALVKHTVTDIGFAPPLVIKKGGTYSGAWRSIDPNVNAITIDTREPVIIKNATVVGPGNLIYGRNINVTISNVAGFGTGTKPGKFLDVTVEKSLIITNNRLSNIWGMRVSGNQAIPAKPASITIHRNIAYNLREGIENRSHFIQLANGLFPSANISENITINAPWKSHVEDVINLYNARGTRDMPIRVHGNRILGAYPLNPMTDGFSGGGIIVDGSKELTPETSSAYIDIRNNVVIDTTNYGIAIASGHDNTINDNIIVSSGVISGDVPIKAQNVGLYIWNINKQPLGTFFDNAAFHNRIYWMKANATKMQTLALNNAWLPDCRKEPGSCFNDVISSSSKLTTGLKIENEIIKKYFGGE